MITDLLSQNLPEKKLFFSAILFPLLVLVLVFFAFKHHWNSSTILDEKTKKLNKNSGYHIVIMTGKNSHKIILIYDHIFLFS